MSQQKPFQSAVFLDRDGTINVDRGYVYRLEDFEFLPRAIDGMRTLQDLGLGLVIITNQSGIARGLYSRVDLARLHDYMVQKLAKAGVSILGIYFCPHLKEPCNCRKPKTGMFHSAADEHRLDLSSSYAIGDKTRDLSICAEQPVKGILLSKEPTTPEPGIRCAPDLWSAAKLVVGDFQTRASGS